MNNIDSQKLKDKKDFEKKINEEEKNYKKTVLRLKIIIKQN